MTNEIKKVLVFFDLFDCPLTALEIWRYLGRKCSLGELWAKLQECEGVCQKGGFFFLAGREAILPVRLRRYNYAQRKFRRVAKVARYFALIPYVRLVAVGNQIGAGNAGDDSDIDFFIVAERKRVWLTRLLAAGAMKLLNLRPRPGYKKDTVCLSFYASSQALALDKVRLDEQDIYFRYWLATLVPVFERGGTYHSLIDNNPWLRQELPNWHSGHTVWPRRIDTFDNAGLAFLGQVFAGLEAPARALQKALLPDPLREAMNRNTNCLINDDMLKLYTNDRREEFRAEYVRRMAGDTQRLGGSD